MATPFSCQALNGLPIINFVTLFQQLALIEFARNDFFGGGRFPLIAFTRGEMFALSENLA